MSDIPADVMDKARATQDAAIEICKSQRLMFPFPTCNGKSVLDETIARAILAERERCIAKLNGERVLPFYVDPSDAEASDIAYDMAIDHGIDAIRG